MQHRKKLDSLKFLFEIVIKLDNKLYKLAIETYYNNPNGEARPYLKHTSYFSKKPKTNEQSNNSYKTVPIKPNLFRQYKKASLRKKKRNNKMCYIYGKLSSFTNNYYSNNIVKYG